MELPLERLVRIGAFVEEQLDQIQRRRLVLDVQAQARTVMGAHVGRGVVHVDGEIERAVVRVGAQVQQLRREIEPIVDDRHHGRREPVAIGQLGIRAALEERRRDVFVSVARREHQRGETAGRMIAVLPFVDAVDVRLPVGLGAGFQQLVDDSDVPFGGGPHQRRFLLIRVGDIGVGARLDEQLHRVDVAGSRGGHQGRFAVGMRGRGVGAGLD